jgi:hypothetical protein
VKSRDALVRPRATVLLFAGSPLRRRRVFGSAMRCRHMRGGSHVRRVSDFANTGGHMPNESGDTSVAGFIGQWEDTNAKPPRAVERALAREVQYAEPSS